MHVEVRGCQIEWNHHRAAVRQADRQPPPEPTSTGAAYMDGAWCMVCSEGGGYSVGDWCNGGCETGFGCERHPIRRDGEAFGYSRTGKVILPCKDHDCDNEADLTAARPGDRCPK